MKKIILMFLGVIIVFQSKSQQKKIELKSVTNYLQGVWRMTNPVPNSRDYQIFIGNYWFWLPSDRELPVLHFFDNRDTNFYTSFSFGFPKYDWQEAAGGDGGRGAMIKYCYEKNHYLNELRPDTNLRDINNPNDINGKSGQLIRYRFEKDSGSQLILPKFNWFTYFDKNSFSIEPPGTQAPQISVYTRVENPPAFVQEFIKKIKAKLFRKITIQTFLFSSPSVPTKMYLMKGDEVEVLEEKSGWLRVRFYGKKLVEGWIRKGDVE